MFRKLSETFTAKHLTIMFVAALAVPSALYGAVATTAVSITDPNTGAKSYIDPGRKLSVFDPIAGYANNPQNYVRLASSCFSGVEAVVYTPPNGKALIMKSANFRFQNATAGSQNREFIYTAGGTLVIGGLYSDNSSDTSNTDFGNGIFIRSGENLILSCSNGGNYFVSISGYLVPSNLVPASSSTEQSVAASAPEARRR